MIAWVMAPIRAPATMPAKTVSSFLGRRYCCVMGRGGNKRGPRRGKGNSTVAQARPRARPGCDTIAAPMLLDVRDLTKRFGGTTVVDGLSFQLAAGECLGVI